jgi:hypothetical protein
MGPNPAHGLLDVLHGRRVRVIRRQAVVDGEDDVAQLGELLGRDIGLVAVGPPSAVDGDHPGAEPAAARSVDVEQETLPSGHAVLDVLLDRDARLRGKRRHEQQPTREEGWGKDASQTSHAQRLYGG